MPVAGSRISTPSSISPLPKCFAAEPVRPVDHEAHDLVGRIDHAEPVGRLGVVDPVEILVDDLEEGLLFRVGGDLRRIGADRRVIGLDGLQRLLLHRAGEERAFQRVEFAGDVVLAVKIRVVEHLGENFLGEDVLDQHLPHVFLRHGGVDRLLGDGRGTSLRPPCGTPGSVAPASTISGAQCVQHGRQVDRELLHRLAEFEDLGALVAEEQFEQVFQRLGLIHPAADHLLRFWISTAVAVSSKMMLSCG